MTGFYLLHLWSTVLAAVLCCKFCFLPIPATFFVSTNDLQSLNGSHFDSGSLGSLFVEDTLTSILVSYHVSNIVIVVVLNLVAILDQVHFHHYQQTIQES